MSTKGKALPYVLKPNFVSVMVGGKPFALQSSHPTFKSLVSALKKKDWARVPKLVSVAQSVVARSAGKVALSPDGKSVTFMGKAVDNNLTRFIIKYVTEGKDVIHLLRFMNNIYANPQHEAVTEFFDWFKNSGLPITDDGCFLAYKSVDDDMKDTHTHTVDNSPGQVIMMPRNVADQNWRTQCSSGFHVCSKQYGVYGTQQMAVKVNPADVLSAQGGKLRTVRYEVIKKLGTKQEDLFRTQGYKEVEGHLVIEYKPERKKLLNAILASKTVKRAIKSKKLKVKTLIKTPLARLMKIAEKYGIGLPAPNKVSEPDMEQFLKKARLAAGLTVNQVAQKMSKSYKATATLEQKASPNQGEVDAYLNAIASCKKLNISRSAITYPKAVGARA